MRYAYLKQNDVVREFQRARRAPAVLPESGPDAFVAHFLHVIGDNPGLLLSLRSDSLKGETLRLGNVEARTFYWFSKLFRRYERLATNPLFTFWPRLTAAVKIFVHLYRFRPDVVLCWAEMFALWAAFLAARVRAASFVYCRHTRLVRENEPWFRRITGFIDECVMRRASKVIVHGPYLRDQVLNIGVDPARLIEFDWSFRDMPLPGTEAEGRLRTINGSGDKILLFIGRLEASKGIFELLEASTERLRDDPRLKLLYAGGGGGFEPLSRQVDARGLAHKVTLLGMVPHDDLAALIRRSVAVVTPTRSDFPEGRCMATMEGLVMEAPVIAPDFGPFRYLVKHGDNGLLFEPDSAEDLKHKLNMLLDDTALYKRLCAGARRSSAELRAQGPNFSEALRQAFRMSPPSPLP